MSSLLRHFAMISAVLLIALSATRAEIITGWVGDLPVPAEALIETDSAVNFDSPSGRVIQFTIHLDLDERALIGYYNQALPELGWRAIAGGFQRGGEVMRVEASQDGAESGRNSFIITLAPAESLSAN